MTDLVESEVLLVSLLAEKSELKAEIERATAARAALPRNDKQGAHELLAKINSMTAAVKRLNPQITHARFEYERKERHTLWEVAVTALWGADGLAACRAQMRQEKIKREGPTEATCRAITRAAAAIAQGANHD